ncbi:hypothetical protein [Duganella callida]|uniref:Uncharacterized protein n=1 Tax=Duganella callida TaxID=2561932 RepID=A0A4Y9SA41_9BURK|nr:hypothetical protein [Duganella callida]TFW18693.1 hypothetical protein E4L98_17765 [Duganella callida]
MNALISLDGEVLVARLDDGRELKHIDAEALANLLWQIGIRVADVKAVDWHDDVESAPMSGQKIAIYSHLRMLEEASDDDQYQSARNQTIGKLLAMPVWISRQELSQSLHEQEGRESQIDLWLSERKIFAVDQVGSQLFAAFQFDDSRRPLGIVSEILAILNKEDEWAVASWFLFPNGWITCKQNGAEVPLAPAKALDDEDAVRNAARNERQGTHFA